MNKAKRLSAIVRLGVVLVIGLLACNDSNRRNAPIAELPAIDSTVLQVESAVILGKRYRAVITTDMNLRVTDAGGDTVLTVPEPYPDFEFIDFNGDSLKDILVHYLSNTPGVQDLILFDRATGNFKPVQDFSKFPDPRPVPGSSLYYSYHRSGCADADWDSDLFYIRDFKAVRIGNIAGRQCNHEEPRDGLYIYKVKGTEKVLVQTMPIETIDGYEDYKWGFIRDYWTRNHARFHAGR